MSFEAGLFIGLITGVIGMAYFVYGKKQSKPVPLVAGLVLMVYPYCIDSLLWALAIGGLLIVIPLIYRPD